MKDIRFLASTGREDPAVIFYANGRATQNNIPAMIKYLESK